MKNIRIYICSTAKNEYDSTMWKSCSAQIMHKRYLFLSIVAILFYSVGGGSLTALF